MILATHAAAGRVATGRQPAVFAAAMAAAVGLLIAGTLGTTGAAIVGTATHLLGAPDEWARIAAALTAAAGLLPATSLARRTWRIERHGEET